MGHSLVTLQKLASVNQCNLMNESAVLWYTLFTTDENAFVVREIMIQFYTSKKMSSVIFTDRHFVKNVYSILSYASTFRAKFNVKFYDALTAFIARDLEISKILTTSQAGVGRSVAITHAYQITCLWYPTCFTLSTKRL